MKTSTSAAINNEGQATGISSAGEHQCVFWFDGTTMKEMKDISGVGSRGFAINASGLVAGDSTYFVHLLNVSRAALFKEGPIRDLGVLAGRIGTAGPMASTPLNRWSVSPAQPLTAKTAGPLSGLPPSA